MAGYTHQLALCTLLLSLTTCTPLPSPADLAATATRNASARARLIHARTTGLRTLAAVLSVVFSRQDRHDTFDLIINYDAAGKIRYSAFKDLILHIQPIFDLMFIGEQYHLITHEAGHTTQHQGRQAQFAAKHPTLRLFLLVGEAFFLPGYDASGHPPIALNAAGTQFGSRLKSGLQATWFCRPDRLEITSARLDGYHASTPVSLQLTYSAYRKVASYHIPGHVTLIDPQLGFTTQAWVKQVEINTPLAPGVFDLSSLLHQPPSPQPQPKQAWHHHQARGQIRHEDL
ncbi:MAG: hypothetical protein O7G88_14510 [bacterium]|nr:hypothetical protein [bacterium]